jgi:hypothetical protein
MRLTDTLRTLAMLLTLLPMVTAAQQPQPNTAPSDQVAATNSGADSSPADSTDQDQAEQKSAPKDDDFKPSEEISEDFPVLLPSDI